MATNNKEFYRTHQDLSMVFSPEGKENNINVDSAAYFSELSTYTEDILPAPRPQATAATDFCSVSNHPTSPWLTIRIKTGTRVDGVPLFRTGAVVDGEVQLDLKKPQTFRDVTVRIGGSITLAQSTAKLHFYLEEKSLVPEWAGLSSKYLAGRHILPFSFTLPRLCNAIQTASALPPTFSSRGQPLSVKYSVSAKVKKTMLRADEHVSLSFSYLPRTRPLLPTPGSELSLGTGPLSVTHSSDMLVWADTSKQISAAIDSNRTVIFDCSLSLANAPIYTRGSFLSFMLSIETWDSPALDLVADASSISVCLRRRTIVALPPSTPGLPPTPGGNGRYTEIITQGRCWLTPGDNFPKRIMRGEIPIRRDLVPHFSIPGLSVIYVVTVKFSAQGYVPSKKAEEYAFVVPIGISTDIHESLSRGSSSSQP